MTPKVPDMTPPDWTLLVVDQAGDRSIEPVQLQKALFLLGRNLEPEHLGGSFYRFSPYDYGPFCGDVYQDAEMLELRGLVSITRRPETRYKLYRVTASGRTAANAFRSQLSARAADYLRKVVEFTQRVSFNQLIRAIYKAYPEMKANSVFQG